MPGYCEIARANTGRDYVCSFLHLSLNSNCMLRALALAAAALVHLDRLAWRKDAGSFRFFGAAAFLPVAASDVSSGPRRMERHPSPPPASSGALVAWSAAVGAVAEGGRSSGAGPS